MRKIATKLRRLAPGSALAISGTPQVGEILSAIGGAGPYQWSREGSAIPGATSSSYIVQAADMGCLMQVSGAGILSPLAGPVIGTTAFYVSSSTGNDSNAGTLAAPWKTIAKVNAQTFAPGTSVLFKRGDIWDRSGGPTVAGTFLPIGGGTSGEPIVYDAYGTGANPIIDGSADASQTSDWTNIGPNLWQSVQTFPPIQVPITFTLSVGNPIKVNWPSPTSPALNGSAIFSNSGGALPAGLSSRTVYYIVNPSGTTSHIAAAPNGTAINATSTAQSGTQMGGANGFPYANGNDVGNILWGFSALGGSAPSAVMNASYGKMTGGGAGGVWYKPLDGTNNIGTTQGNWNFNTDNFRVQIYSVGNPATVMPGLRLALDGGFADLGSLNPYMTFQNFTFQNSGYASAFSTRASNITLRDCVFQWIGGCNVGGASTANSRAGDGVETLGSYRNILIERNYFYQMYDAGIAPQLPTGIPHDSLTIRNNIFHRFGYGISPLLVNNVAGATQNGLYIYNNTTYGVASWSANQRPNGGGSVWAIWLTYDANITTTNTNIQNNAFAGINNFGIIVTSQPSAPYPSSSLSTMAPVTVDHNNWKASSGTAVYFGYVPTATNTAMSIWAPANGFEAHGLIDIDPSFTNQSGANFTPAPGSPLRNAGANLSGAGVVWDFNHKPRPTLGPFTIGALQ